VSRPNAGPAEQSLLAPGMAAGIQTHGQIANWHHQLQTVQGCGAGLRRPQRLAWYAFSVPV